MKKRILQSILALFTVAFTANAQVPSYVPSTGLVGWWPYTGNVNDLSTAGNNFTNGGATLTTDRFNATNEAYNFSGSNQSMTLSTPSFTFGPTSSFTVSFWMYKPTLSYGIAVMNSSGVSGNFVWNVQTSAAGAIQFGANKQGSSWAWAQSTYSVNQWIHVVAVFNNGAMTFYKDGLSVATQTFTNTTAASTNLPLYVGKSHAGNNFTGKIDDLGIWNRALTQAEITLLYTGCDVVITGQPVNRNAVNGAPVLFTSATSSAAATSQWQHDLGSGFVDITNGGQYSGVTTDTLTVLNTTLANNNEKFRCVFVNGTGCSDTSNTATLTVCGSLNVQPASKSVAVGSAVEFVTASTDPMATYQWQLAVTTNFGDLFNGAVFSGVTTDTLRMTTTTLTNNNQKFRCIVTSGLCTDTTDIAVLTVSNNVGIEEEAAKKVRVYPNPAKNVLSVEVGITLQQRNFVIVNQLGNVVLQGEISGEETKVDISKLAAGIYVIRVGNQYQESFAIQK